MALIIGTFHKLCHEIKLNCEFMNIPSMKIFYQKFSEYCHVHNSITIAP